VYAGQHWYDGAAAQGVQTRRRNPKRKARLPYHAKKLFDLPRMEAKGKTCVNALTLHQDHNWPYIGDDGTKRTRQVTMSVAMPCLINHKSTTQNPTHKDSSGRTWQ
jgi:hypothetical protein